jgi:glycosyltransferase involved in cell wall biosynthesis
MKVLYIDDLFDPFSSVRPKTELMVELSKKGIEVLVMADGYEQNLAVLENAGIHPERFLPLKKLSKTAQQKILGLVREHEVDIVYAGDNKSISNAVFALKKHPAKLIAYRGARGPYWQDPFAWLTHLHPRIDAIACNSLYVRDFLRTQLKKDSRKAVNIYRGQRSEWYSHAQPDDLSAFNIPRDAFVVGCVANIRKVKGAPYFLKAIDQLSDFNDIHFLFIGHGDQSKDMQRLLRSIKHRDRIHLTGYREDAINLVAACDLYVQPSLSEGISRSVVEAMSLGICPVVSYAGGNPELVTHDETGMVVPAKSHQAVAEAIRALYLDRDKRDRLGMKARERIDTVFSLDNTVDAFIRLFYALKRGETLTDQ